MHSFSVCIYIYIYKILYIYIIYNNNIFRNDIKLCMFILYRYVYVYKNMCTQYFKTNERWIHIDYVYIKNNKYIFSLCVYIYIYIQYYIFTYNIVKHFIT